MLKFHIHHSSQSVLQMTSEMKDSKSMLKYLIAVPLFNIYLSKCFYIKNKLLNIPLYPYLFSLDPRLKALLFISY